jgi:hypothetical protein
MNIFQVVIPKIVFLRACFYIRKQDIAGPSNNLVYLYAIPDNSSRQAGA